MKYRHERCGQTFRRPHSHGRFTCPKCKQWMCNCEECVGSGYVIVLEPRKIIKRFFKKLRRRLASSFQ